MTLDWTLSAAVGLMVGLSFGVLLELRYLIQLDVKIERLIEKVERIELRLEREMLHKLHKKRSR